MFRYVSFNRYVAILIKIKQKALNLGLIKRKLKQFL